MTSATYQLTVAELAPAGRPLSRPSSLSWSIGSICSIRGPRALAGSGSGDGLGRARHGAVRAGRMYRNEALSMSTTGCRTTPAPGLADGVRDLRVGTLARRVGLSIPTTSQHLAKLRLARIVSARREGRHTYYTVEDPHVLTMLDQIFGHIAPDGTLAPDP